MKKNILIIICMLLITSSVNAQSTKATNSFSSSRFIGWGTTSGDLSFKTNNVTRMILKDSTGKFGIGTTFPDSRLHVNSSDNANLTAPGIFTIGALNNKNLVFDNDEIQARGNGSAALLYLNRSNGNVWIGNDAIAGSATPVLHINSSTGNAGVGTTAVSDNRLFINGSDNNPGGVLRCKVNYSNSAHGTTILNRAISGISTADDAFGVGVYGEGTFQGVYGYATGSGNSDHHGVEGVADGSGSGKHIGVYGSASGGSENYGGYFDTKVFANAIRIGDVGNEAETETSGYKLAVDGKIICEELKVQNSNDWPDYVFSENYQLMSIDELEKSITENKHLPGIPPASEVRENGLSIGDMQYKMMEKIEQLSLYIIELKHQKDDLAKRLAKLENK